MIYSPPSKHRRRKREEKKRNTREREGERETGSLLDSLHLHALELARLMFWKTRIGKSRMQQMAPRDWICFEKNMFASDSRFPMIYPTENF